MGIAPTKPVERIVFYREKTKTTGPWKLQATNIGTTSVAVDALNALALAAQAAYDDLVAKRNAAKTATQNFKLAVANMSDGGSDMLKQIKAKAAIDGDEVYVLADIPSPAIPSPVLPPGKAYDFRVKLEDNGAPTFSFKCPNPRGAVGTTYLVARQLGGTGAFVIIGSTGQKRYTDNTLPAGTTTVAYRVTGQRSTAQGPMADFTVKFGVGGAGEMTASITEPPQPKLAA